MASNVIEAGNATALRAKEFERKGVQAYDALHLACAEAGADVFLTVDDKFLKLAVKIDDLKMPISNPLK